jgi:hypothetical protein
MGLLNPFWLLNCFGLFNRFRLFDRLRWLNTFRPLNWFRLFNSLRSLHFFFDRLILLGFNNLRRKSRETREGNLDGGEWPLTMARQSDPG